MDCRYSIHYGYDDAIPRYNLTEIEMNSNYINMIKDILGDMREKKMDPVGKADKDIDNDGDVDSSDEYLHKRRAAIKKSMKKEDDDKMTPCPKCDGSMDNHDPECPDHPNNKGKNSKEEGCGDYDKKTKKEEVEHDLDENYRTLATKGMGAETKKSISVGRQVDYFHPSNGDKKQGSISKIHATGYHVKDDDDGKTHKFDFHDRAKAKKMMESNQPVVSEQWGFGEVIETTDEGLNVYFDHGVEFNVPASSLTFIEDKQHTKGATPPEGLLDKESPRSKQFVKDHQKSDKEVEDKEKKGHEDATKAGRATKQSPARPGEPRKGDTKIINPVKGAVTQTTGKE